MKFHLPVFVALASFGIAVSGETVAPSSGALFTSWQTSNSRQYARVWQTTADRAANSTSTTWPRAGLRNAGGGQSTAAYSDIQRVAYSDNYVYVYATGLSSHMMGPWYSDTAKTQIFGNWPAAASLLWRFPRQPSGAATTKTATTLGPIAISVNGVVIFSGLDAASYSTASGTESPQGDKVWNRDALLNEGVTFDAAKGHQPQNGQYHYHLNPVALRWQLGDHVTYNAATDTYTEATIAPAHSPILGWAPDGYPIYGPYGYSSPMDASSGVRRMIVGFQKRDGTNGTTNLAVTGRTTLPKWAAEVQSRSQTLAATQYGPAVNSTYVLGNYQEDYDYLGDLGRTLGKDFDLDRANGRFCVTPEFPSGTYAYFTTIAAGGDPVWPYIIGPQFYGVTSGGQVRTLTETLTDYTRAGTASAINVTAASTGNGVVLTWTSVEGATYSIATSSDNSAFTMLASAVTSSGTTTTLSTPTQANYYQVTLTALASYATTGTGGISGIGNSATAPLPMVGTTGTARLINVAVRAQVGGTAGTLIAGFVVAGSGTKKMVARAVGPTLSSFGVGGALADPSLTLVAGATTLATNDNWPADDAVTFSSVGAFALGASSRDAAVVTSVTPGGYSAIVGAGGGSGVSLLEVYDGDAGDVPAKLVNASTRAFVGTGEQVLIPGFVIGGSGSIKLLIRAVGPTLTNFGVSSALADPQLTLYQGATALGSNDNWSNATNATNIAAAASQVGAFALTSGSRDAAMLATLNPGSYTVTVSGVGSATGTALVELYVVP
jgi:hypothetical protein